MNTLFPFGFPFPTAVYLTLYVLTIVLHVLFMNYVMAGSGYLAISSMFRLIVRPSRPPSLINDAIRDWLPAALGAAITAGVAPLLFLQILYKENFYSANLLLLHRWMAILPVLIVGFYLLYLIKSGWALRQPAWVRVAVSFVAFLAFAFVAWSWTENHLLSLAQSEWPGFYTDEQLFYRSPQLLPRLLLWTVGSIPIFCVWMNFQLRSRMKATPVSDEALVERYIREIRTLGRLALVGMVLTVAAGAWYLSAARDTVWSAISEPLSLPWFLLACLGMIIQLFVWIPAALRTNLKSWPARWPVYIAGFGAIVTALGMSVVRESIRLHSIDISRFYAHHEAAAEVGGFWVFVVFAMVNIGIITWCVRLVVRTAKWGPGKTAG